MYLITACVCFSLSSEQATPLPGMAHRCQGRGGEVLQQHAHLRHHRHRLCRSVRRHGGPGLLPLPLPGLAIGFILNLIPKLDFIFSSIPGAKSLGKE